MGDELGLGRTGTPNGVDVASTPSTPIDDDLTLPRATVYKIIHEMLPPGISCAKETRDLLVDCCTEFVHLISSEANDVCERAGRKTIAPEHVVDALRALGFGDYIEQVEQAHEEHQTQSREKDRSRSSNKFDATGMTEEELQRQQEELFAQARMKYQQSQLMLATSTTISNVSDTKAAPNPKPTADHLSLPNTAEQHG